MSTPQAANNVLRQTPSIKELLLKMETFNADIGKQTDSPGVDGEKFARIGSETSQDGHLPAARSLSSQFMLAASPIARRIFGSIDSAEPLNGNMVPMQAEALESAWIELRNTWDTLGQRKRRNRASELVVHGIPASVRSMMWPVLVETVNEGSMRDLYNTLLRRTSSHAEAIKRDINTIVLTHQELRKLDVKVVSRVVEALVLNDLQCSNITGLVYLSMILLMQVPEEDCFAIITVMMNDMKLRAMFIESECDYTVLNVWEFQLLNLTNDNMPPLHAHLSENNVEVSSYLYPWMQSMFLSALPLPVVLHIIDYLLVCGTSSSLGCSVVFLRIALSILYLCKDSLIKLDGPAITAYLNKSIMKRFAVEVDSDEIDMKSPNESSRKIIARAVSFDVSSRRLLQLRKFYEDTVLSSRDKEDRLNVLKLEVSELQELVEMREKMHASLLAEVDKQHRDFGQIVMDLTSRLEQQDEEAERLKQENAELFQKLSVEDAQDIKVAFRQDSLDYLTSSIAGESRTTIPS